MTRPRRLALAAFYAALSAIFAVVFYLRYWRWSDCFNDQGRCYDPESAQVFTTGGMVWGLAAALLLALALRHVLQIGNKA